METRCALPCAVLFSVVDFFVQFYLREKDNIFHIVMNPIVHFVMIYIFEIYIFEYTFSFFKFSCVYFPSCLFENE